MLQTETDGTLYENVMYKANNADSLMDWIDEIGSIDLY